MPDQYRKLCEIESLLLGTEVEVLALSEIMDPTILVRGFNSAPYRFGGSETLGTTAWNYHGNMTAVYLVPFLAEKLK